MLKLTVLLGILTLVTPLRAQVVVPPQPGNQLSVKVTASVTQDTTGLYTYNYSVSNSASSIQNAWFIVAQLAGDAAQSIVNPQSPTGWTFMKSPNGPTVSWAATDPGTVSDNGPDDGSVPPSPYEIQPGQSLAGFSFQSAKPPTAIRIYVQGFAPIPAAGDAGDLDEAGYQSLDLTQDSVITLSQGPQPSNSAVQLSGQGFMTFVGLGSGMVQAPLTVGVQFNSQAVNQSGFVATLNGVDVTQNFAPTSPGTKANLTATFAVGTSPLQNGPNVLEASVPVSATNQGTTPAFDLAHLDFTIGTSPNLASGTSCNGVYGGNFTGNLVVSAGQNCSLVNASVSGNVRVNGGQVSLSSTLIGGDLQVQGDGGSFSVSAGTTINGNLAVHNLVATNTINQVCGSSVGGNLQFMDNNSAVQIGSGPGCPGNFVTGDLQIINNAAGVQLVGNGVGGNLQVLNNNGSAQVFSNRVTYNLQCQSDSSITGGGNTAASKRGQCSRF
jgi:hypothetical protein